MTPLRCVEIGWDGLEWQANREGKQNQERSNRTQANIAQLVAPGF